MCKNNNDSNQGQSDIRCDCCHDICDLDSRVKLTINIGSLLLNDPDKEFRKVFTLCPHCYYKWFLGYLSTHNLIKNNGLLPKLKSSMRYDKRHIPNNGVHKCDYCERQIAEGKQGMYICTMEDGKDIDGENSYSLCKSCYNKWLYGRILLAEIRERYFARHEKRELRPFEFKPHGHLRVRQKSVKCVR